MYSRILAPLDGSSRAEAIIPHIEGMATRYGAEILLVRVVEPVNLDLSIFDVPPSRRLQEVVDEMHAAKAYLSRWEDELRTHDIRVQTFVRYGAIVKTILDIAVAEKVDLIAIASHGRTGLKRIMYGSVAAGILHQAECPLLIIRADTDALVD